MNAQEFGTLISNARKSKKLSQKQLGDLLDVSNKAVSKWENGESMPRRETLLKLCNILELDKADILGVSDATSEEINDLKNENIQLKHQIEKINKSKSKAIKYIFSATLIFIIIAIGLSLTLNFAFSQNNKIDDIAQEGTKIVFSQNEFVPIYKELEYTVNHEFNFGECDKKYAKYIDKNNKTKKVLIYCDMYSDFVAVKAGGKNYYYANSKVNYLKCTPEFIDHIETSTSSITNKNFYEYHSLMLGDKVSNCDGKVLLDYLNSDKKEVSKKIVELYLGNKTERIIIHLKSNNDISNLNITSFCPGEFFKDDKDNIYFYDYNTSKAYEAGKEFGEYVYK